MSRRTRWIVFSALALTFAGLAVLVSAGQLDHIDSYAVRHWTPGGLPQEKRIPFFGKYFGYHGHHFDASQVVRLPVGVIASVMVLLLGCAILRRRRRSYEAVVWLGAFAAGTAVGLICKEVLAKPLVYDGHTPLVEFTSSFPSGHAIRTVLLAVMFASIWPRLRWLLALWAAGAVVSLEIDRIHALSDLAGGVLLAAVVLVAARLDLGGTKAAAHAKQYPPRLHPSPKPTRSD